MVEEEIHFTPERVFLTSELKGVEKPYPVATPDGAVLALNTLRVEKQPLSQEEGGFEIEKPPTFVMTAGLWGRATHIPLMATLARFGEVVGISQPQRYERGDSLSAGLEERFPNARSVKVITAPHLGHGLPVADADLLSFEVVRKILSIKPVKSLEFKEA